MVQANFAVAKVTCVVIAPSSVVVLAGTTRGVVQANFDVVKVTCPVVICHGASDAMVPPAHAKHTADLIPHAELRLYPGRGHLGMAEYVMKASADVAKLAAVASTTEVRAV